MQSPKRILLIDDDATTIFLTQRLLKRFAIEVEVLTAAHGQEALAIVRAVCEQEQCPELIFLDINMPIMDGFEFLEQLQKSANLSKAAIKIILVSSSTHQLDLAKAKQYPLIGYIEKPLTSEKLSEFLQLNSAGN
ncbi:response regulator [Adhaeribacter rhizoryzae]|uniref:Response regulator n=1 Tax=Adhaeribacter rhizoryzae TaxID=2607907 RepID=A0A5M6D3B1_9BACT|nr:response regulator [Adhaeribacter rhizoryzae]KAA5539665.1 response regulator [Adhaeribacter rhizoryzae]